ncbi:hypothetical protein ACIA58_00935 [Kribbella sp. NPDC051586]|uniref:GH12 family glycosyl hydrolase domain-containing protein n=1 Tax=Kribbella sp. NPDC051586 TaxID=3364118 RepID=UPI0037A21EAF
MPPTRTARRRKLVPAVVLAVGALVAAPIVVHAAKDSPVSTANAADSTVSALPSVGRVETCVLDAYSGCTVLHGFGQKPVAITATASGPAMVSIDPSRTTDKDYRLRAVRYDGKKYRAGTKLTYTVHYDFTAVPAQPTTPTPTSAPTTTATPTKPPTTTTPTATPTHTTTTPTKPPTSTTTAPTTTTPTSTGSPSATCTNPSFVTTSTNNQGDGRTFGAYYVHNNMWNNDNGTYTLSACNYNNWFLDVTQPKPGDNGVQAYPNVHKDYNDVALSKIQSAKFAASTPANCSACVYDVAFDVWVGDGLNNELMIWTDNKGQTPAGRKSGTVTFGGFTYDVWHEDGYTAYVSQVTQKSGTMPLASFFNDMATRGWAPKQTTWQVDYGVEVVSTGNTKQRFNFTDFSIQEN